MVEDVLHVDHRFPRTVLDTVLRPSRVLEAALAGDDSRYTRPLKVFLTVFAAQTLVSGWLGINDTGTFQVLLADDPSALAGVQARLAAAGSSLAEADEIIRHWTSWVAWPLIMVGSLLYAFAIWAMRPRLGLVNAILLYLVAAAASNAATLPVTVVGGLFGPTGSLVATGIGFAALFAYAGVLMHRRAADSAFGLAMRVTGLVAATLPMLLVAGLLVFWTVEIPFMKHTGLSRLQLVIEAMGPRA